MREELREFKEEVEAPPKKKKAKLVLIGLLTLAFVVSGGLYVVNTGKETTDNAQIEGHLVNISSRISGQVKQVFVKDNQEVKAGDVLVELDPAEVQARLEAARADLAAAQANLTSAQVQAALTEHNAHATLQQAQGTLTQANSGLSGAQAALNQAKADVVAADSRLKLADLELQRVLKLRERQVIAEAELDTRRSQYDQAKAALDQARAKLENTRTGIEGSQGQIVSAQGRLASAATAPQQIQAAQAVVEVAHARLKQMQASLNLAELNLGYTQIKAPIHGIVSRRTVEAGQMVSPDRALLVLVPLDQVWVVANFKETQVAELQPGQAAKVSVDAYGSQVFPGKVESIAGASGSKFSLLPPDNASGNFIKVVQRVPVKIIFERLPEQPLRPGMSADVTVKTGDTLLPW